MRDADKGPLPAIFRTAPFPLLLSAQVNMDNSWYIHELGLLTLTGDGRLLRWNIHTQGAEQLATGLPPGRIFSATAPTNDSGRICVILGRLSTRGLHAVLMSRDGKVDAAVPLQAGGIGSPAVIVDQTVAYIATNQSVAAIDLTSRSFSTVPVVPQVSAADVRSGRMFKTISQLDGTLAWYRPALLGQRVEYVMVSRRELLWMFEVRRRRPGWDHTARRHILHRQGRNESGQSWPASAGSLHRGVARRAQIRFAERRPMRACTYSQRRDSSRDSRGARRRALLASARTAPRPSQAISRYRHRLAG